VSGESNKGNPPTKRGRDQARYANFFQIGHNAFEFLIEFGQQETIHTRIYVSPQHAQILSTLLIETLQQHKQLFGGASLTPQEPAPEDRTPKKGDPR
jgi:hypothetical protein